ncbi:ATP-dependent translocase ABCB1 isoform X3 [Cryptotermes secundus]|uniref:ATP-dependent translocase ABCB1 isoform X3 n=1 Tax=Cryptotermes secundus TaxID=105785 RepID=UPI001454D510|nr:ATP-dependent translocase ABCB1 isoform X3 [Cryptotermes secundus]
MKQEGRVEDGSNTSAIRIESLGEDDLSLHKMDPLEVKFSEQGTKEKKKDDIEPISFFKLFRFSTWWERLLLFVCSLGALTTGGIATLHVWLFGELSGKMMAYSMATQTGSDLDKYAFLDAVLQFTVLSAALGFVSLVFTSFSVWMCNHLAHKQILQIRNLYFKSILSQDIGWHDVHHTGDFVSSISEDIMKLEDGIGEKVIQFTHIMATCLGCFVLALTVGWHLAPVSLSSLLITMAVVIAVTVILSRLSKKEMEAYGIAGSVAEEVLSSIRTVKAFGGEDSEVKRYKANLINAKNISVKRGLISGIAFGGLLTLMCTFYALGSWYGVGLVLEDKYKPEDEIVYMPQTMVTVFVGVMVASLNFSTLSAYIEAFSMAKGAGARIFSVIDHASPINNFSKDGKRPEQMNGNICFRDVHFEYPTRADVKVLQGLNLDINCGETVALVGSSGCGKSTFIKLIQRFYDPQQGMVMVDGNNVKELNVSWLRKHIGVVGQEPVLFNTTIAENIGYGADGATESDIQEAAKEANAHDFISKLPQGYNTLVGERGAQLSGGQKQRIAIARALVRKPVILLLDEATSALDTASESKVKVALDRASRYRTTVIIAHRLSTIMTADKIVVISNGKVVEQGTHKELLSLKGHYHALVSAQQLNIVDDMENENEESEGRVHSLCQVLIPGRGNSAGSDFSIHKDERPAVIEDNEEEPSPPVSMIRILKKNMPEWPQLLMGSLASIIVSSATPIFVILFGDILRVMSSPVDQEVRAETDRYSLYFFIAGVSVGFATFLQNYAYGIAGEKLTMRLREELFESMVRQEVAWFDKKSNLSGSLCARLSGDASSVQGATGQRVGIVLQSIMTVGWGIGLAIYFDWRLGLVTIFFTPVILLAQYFFLRISRGEIFSNQQALEKFTELAVEAVSNIHTVVSLGLEQTFHQRYMLALLQAHKIPLWNTLIRAFVFGLAQSILFFANSATLFYGGILMVENDLTFDTILKVGQALIMGTMLLAIAMGFAPNFQKGMSAASRIFHILDRKPQIHDPPQVNERKWTANGNVKYQQVKFFYPTRPNIMVLQGLNADVLEGQTVAIVGKSGCGKSTCIQLLERFYDPDSGCVYIDEHDVSSLTTCSLRFQLGIVSQEPVLFDRTIAENIAYGDNSRTVPMSEIIEAAKKASIHSFITTLPLGYDTLMGEKGMQLSGGQKQRIAIARALIRNPRILLLDEATSALDTESEKVVQEALDKAKEGCTCITITHRLSTIQNADVIFVINNGQVAEMGTHSELLAQHGLYYKLYSMHNGPP